MRLAISLTSWVCAWEAASLPASMSTWFAVTTMAAICASLGASAAAATVVRHRLVAITTPIILMIKLLTLNGSGDAYAPTGIRSGGGVVRFRAVARARAARAGGGPAGRNEP